MKKFELNKEELELIVKALDNLGKQTREEFNLHCKLFCILRQLQKEGEES